MNDYFPVTGPHSADAEAQRQRHEETCEYKAKYEKLLAAANAVMCDDKAHRNAIFESSGVARNWCKFEAAIREAEEGKA